MMSIFSPRKLRYHHADARSTRPDAGSDRIDAVACEITAIFER